MIETRLPTWPRLLSAELAAAYLSISRTSFLDGVKNGEWPAPIRFQDGTRHVVSRWAVRKLPG